MINIKEFTMGRKHINADTAIGLLHQKKLSFHERNHTEANPYECSKCNKTFTQKYKLRVHQRLHTRMKPYH